MIRSFRKRFFIAQKHPSQTDGQSDEDLHLTFQFYGPTLDVIHNLNINSSTYLTSLEIVLFNALNNHEGSIPFTRSNDLQALTKLCSNSAVNSHSFRPASEIICSAYDPFLNSEANPALRALRANRSRTSEMTQVPT